MLARVERAGYRNLVITWISAGAVYLMATIIAERFFIAASASLRLAWDGIIRPRWLFGTFLRTLYHHGIPHFENNYAQRGIAVISKNVTRDFSGRTHLDWSYLERVGRYGQARP